MPAQEEMAQYVSGDLQSKFKDAKSIGSIYKDTRVFQAFDKQNRDARYNILRAPLSGEGRALAERAQKVSSLGCPQLTSVKEIFTSNDHLYLVTEAKKESITLDAMLKSSSEAEQFSSSAVAHVVSNVAKALQSLHASGLVHGNVKASNVLCDLANDFAVKLVDTSMASSTSQAAHDFSVSKSHLGGWITPECAEERVGRVPKAKDDIFALGALAFTMAKGSQPHVSTTNQGSLLAALKNGLFQQVADAALSGFISRCMDRDFSKRFTTMEQVLAHPFLKDSGDADKQEWEKELQ